VTLAANGSPAGTLSYPFRNMRAVFAAFFRAAIAFFFFFTLGFS
jgi:hypothetical protein